MTEWMEVMNQFNRMCLYYHCKHECPMACPMNGVNISHCRKIAFEEPEVTEKTVMTWAAENPEPVYPTWGEWLHSLHVVGVHAMCAPEPNFYYAIDDKFNAPIPADIAQRLGIEPKEGA